jgi:hypothetical protein
MTETTEAEATEGWALVRGRYVAGYAGSASGKEHYFRDGRSLCGRQTAENIQMAWLGLKPDSATMPCKICSRLRRGEAS